METMLTRTSGHVPIYVFCFSTFSMLRPRSSGHIDLSYGARYALIMSTVRITLAETSSHARFTWFCLSTFIMLRLSRSSRETLFCAHGRVVKNYGMSIDLCELAI